MRRLGAWLLLLCAVLTACGTNTAVQMRSFTALDTVCSVKLYDGGSAELLQRAVELVEHCEGLWSRTVPTSDIARLNSGEAAQVSAETDKLLETALSWSTATGGAFDITIAPYKALWETASTVPDEKALAEASACVGSDKLLREPWRLTQGAGLDLGAIAKGAIADKLCALLKEDGCRGAILDLGGNITAFGKKADGSAFQVAIADPLDPSRTVLTVAASDVTLSTSGSYERFYELDGKRYSHLLDPATGLPVENDLRSVTVISPCGTTADVLSTACFVMGFEAAKAFVEGRDDAEAVFVKTDGSVVWTDGVKTAGASL